MNTHIYVLAKKSATLTIQIWLRSGYFTGLFYWPTAPKRFSVTCIGPHLTWNLQISGASRFGNFGEVRDLGLSVCIWYTKYTINLPLACGGNIRMCQLGSTVRMRSGSSSCSRGGSGYSKNRQIHVCTTSNVLQLWLYECDFIAMVTLLLTYGD